jgi:hypothetical protein
MDKEIEKSKIKSKNCGIRLWRMISLFFIFYFLSFILFIGGCAVQKRACSPLSTASQASAVLTEYAGGLKPLRATGNCSLNYKDEKGKNVTQSFPVKIWFESSKRYCLYGDILFDPKGMSFAVNGSKYWVYAKPFGVYAKGEIDENSGKYFSNPAVFLDFLQPLDSVCDSVSMTNSDSIYDVLICRDVKSCVQKKIFMDRCDHFVRKIEYYDCSDNPALVVELDDYKKAAGMKSLVFPRKLTYSYFAAADKYQGQSCSDRREIKLNSVKLWRPSESQLKALFSPPEVNSSENKETK